MHFLKMQFYLLHQKKNQKKSSYKNSFLTLTGKLQLIAAHFSSQLRLEYRTTHHVTHTEKTISLYVLYT